MSLKLLSQKFTAANLFTFLVAIVAMLFVWIPSALAQVDSTTLAMLKSEADSLLPLVTTPVAREFLSAVPDLPHIAASRFIYFRKETREYMRESDYQLLPDSARISFVRREFNEEFYYYTRYGTPLAFVRPLDLVAQAGLEKIDGSRIAEFGFGTIGQLRLLASLGAHVVGIEADSSLKILYSDSADTGDIPRAQFSAPGPKGVITTLYGSFPFDTNLVRQVGAGLDLFISKNTLKRGYIHPERDVDPRMLVHLVVDDSTFVKQVYDLLKPGGLFMIYNLHPALSASDQPYIPWSDGRSPFDKALFEKIGFKVLAFDLDDTEFARRMGKALGWAAQMNFDKDLFGTYTLVKK